MMTKKETVGPASQGRRSFLKISGQLVIGFSLLSSGACNSSVNSSGVNGLSAEPLRASAGPDEIDSWIRIDNNGNVSVLTGKMELGQGIRTALMQIAAEELDVDMNRVRIITADTGITPNESYTAGSASIESSGKSIRFAAAEARHTLLQMAALKFKSNISQLSVSNGIIKLKDTNKSIAYNTLLEGKWIEGKVTGKASLKNPASYKLIGTAYPRADILSMATGQPIYVHDIRLDGMVHARVLRPPAYKASLVTLNSAEITAMQGVLKVVKLGSFVAVITKQEYQAVKALSRMREIAEWKMDKLPPQDDLYQEMISNSAKGSVVSEKGSVSTAFNSNNKKVEAIYKRPYQMHGSIGPSCAVAQWKEKRLTVWSPTQGVYPLRETISDMLGISKEQIRVTGVQGSGCYGHNGADDVSADAALLAREMEGLPVRVQWMREDEHRWEPYGSAMVISLEASIDPNNRIEAYKSSIWSDTHSTRPGGRAGHFIAARSLEKPFDFNAGRFSGGSYRNGVPYYQIAAQEITLHNYSGPLRTSALRGLGAYANIFAMESFMDELALKAGEDPVQFRIKHLEDERAKAVINMVASKAGWGKNLPSGTGRGIAFSRYKNTASYFAVVAEVSINKESKTIRVNRLTGCIDSGQAINPDGIKNQTSGGMIQSASWTLFEQVTYNASGISSNNWETYPIIRFDEVPETEVFIIDRPEMPSLGAGEAAQGPTSAAIANALAMASGERIRELPLTVEKLSWNR